jgi:hypothetical protein
MFYSIQECATDLKPFSSANRATVLCSKRVSLCGAQYSTQCNSIVYSFEDPIWQANFFPKFVTIINPKPLSHCTTNPNSKQCSHAHANCYT